MKKKPAAVGLRCRFGRFGTDLEKMSAKELELYRREKLGFVFQSYNLTPDLTVRENIEMTAELVQEPLSTDTLIEELGLKKYFKISVHYEVKQYKCRKYF
jgi:ABC-type lipoprotein export system ATPase subunit